MEAQPLNAISRWKVSSYTIKHISSAKACMAHAQARDIIESLRLRSDKQKTNYALVKPPHTRLTEESLLSR